MDQEPLHVLYYTVVFFHFHFHKSLPVQAIGAIPYIVMPSALLNTPDKHFTNVAAR